MLSTIRKTIYLFDSRTRLQFLFLFLLMLINAILETIGIGLILPFIAVVTNPDIVESNKYLRYLKELTSARGQFDFLIVMSIGFIVLYIMKNSSVGLLNYVQMRFIFLKRSSLATKLLKSYIVRPYAFHLEKNTAELFRNVGIETPRVFNFVQSLLKICSEICVFSSVLIMLIWVNPMIVVSGISIMSAVSVIYYTLISSYSTTLGLKVQSSQKYIGQAVLEGLGAIKEIKISGREEYFPKKFNHYMIENARANWKYSMINMMPRLFLEIVAVGSLIMMIIFFQIQEKDIATFLPVLSLFAIATIRLMPSLSQIVSHLQSTRFDAPSVDVIYKDMKQYVDINMVNSLHEKNNKKNMKFDSAIKACDINYIYPKSTIKILSGISFEILKGQAIAFAGPSGAGKTTLVNLILGLITPSDGNIFADDRSVFENISAWQRNIGYVPQSIYLLDDTVRNNIAFGLNDNEIDDQQVMIAVKIAQLETFVNELPNGLNTIIGENGVRLSGGQRQRLGIARALYHDPDILILDEATSSLDGETEQEVSSAIEMLSGQKTLIIIAHRLSTIQRCDKIYYMENGTITASGTFNELLSTNEKFKRMAESGAIEI